MKSIDVCPKCGSDRVSIVKRWRAGFGSISFDVKCYNCGCYATGFKSVADAVANWNSYKSEFRPEPTNLEKFGPDLRKVITTYVREVLCHEAESFIAAKVQTLEDFCRWAIAKNAEGAK